MAYLEGWARGWARGFVVAFGVGLVFRRGAGVSAWGGLRRRSCRCSRIRFGSSDNVMRWPCFSQYLKSPYAHSYLSCAAEKFPSANCLSPAALKAWA